jgi:hypothetical protein
MQLDIKYIYVYMSKYIYIYTLLEGEARVNIPTYKVYIHIFINTYTHIPY